MQSYVARRNGFGVAVDWAIACCACWTQLVGFLVVPPSKNKTKLVKTRFTDSIPSHLLCGGKLLRLNSNAVMPYCFSSPPIGCLQWREV